jgi:microcystin-dependent protein
VLRPGANISITGVGTTTNPYVISSQGDAGQAVPSGTVVMYAGDLPPAGYLICNGSAVSRVSYAALYAAIGTAFGVGDGSTTFTLPDMRDRLPLGTSTTRTRGSVGGAVSATLTSAHIPQHTHSIDHDHASFFSGAMNQNSTHSHAIDGAITGYQAGVAGGIHFGHIVTNPNYGGLINNANTDHLHLIDVPYYSGTSGAYGTASPTAVPTLPPYLSLNFLIKT